MKLQTTSQQTETKTPTHSTSHLFLDRIKAELPSLITGILIAAIGALVGGGITYWTQNKKPTLVYQMFPGAGFQGDVQNIGIYTVQISNQGNAIAEDVIISLQLQDQSPITSLQIETSNRSIPYSWSQSSNGQFEQVHIDNLNPQEEVKIVALSTDVSTLEVDVRAKGFLGTQSQEPESKLLTAFLFGVIGALSSLLFLALSGVTGYKTISKELDILVADYKKSILELEHSQQVLDQIRDQVKDIMDDNEKNQ